LWILKKYVDTHITDGYEYKYGMNIYLAGTVHGSYYSYSMCLVDIPTKNFKIFYSMLKA